MGDQILEEMLYTALLVPLWVLWGAGVLLALYRFRRQPLFYGLVATCFAAFFATSVINRGIWLAVSQLDLWADMTPELWSALSLAYGAVEAFLLLLLVACAAFGPRPG